jgi:hypothetical protein
MKKNKTSPTLDQKFYKIKLIGIGYRFENLTLLVRTEKKIYFLIKNSLYNDMRY